MEKSCCAAKKPDPPSLRAALALYRPLIVIGGVSALGAAALAVQGRVSLMDGLMGLFLCLLAVLKLFDVRAFAGVFSKYDPLAARVAAYGRVYPFLELALGVLYLSGVWLTAVNGITFAVFAVNAAGVIHVLRSGINVQCACAGAGFGLPVGKVTLFEDAAMTLMAIFGLLY